MFWKCLVFFFLDFCKYCYFKYFTPGYTPRPSGFLLLDNSALKLNSLQNRISLAVSTAAKNTILEPSNPATFIWLSYFRCIVLLEGTTTKLNGASDKTIQNWAIIAEILLDKLKCWHCNCVDLINCSPFIYVNNYHGIYKPDSKMLGHCTNCE